MTPDMTPEEQHWVGRQIGVDTRLREAAYHNPILYGALYQYGHDEISYEEFLTQMLLMFIRAYDQQRQFITDHFRNGQYTTVSLS